MALKLQIWTETCVQYTVKHGFCISLCWTSWQLKHVFDFFFANKIWLDSCVLRLKIEAWQERENFTGPCCPAVLAASAIKCRGLIQHGWAGDIFENNSPQLIRSVQANTCSWQNVKHEGKNLERTGWWRGSQAAHIQYVHIYIYTYISIYI